MSSSSDLDDRLRFLAGGSPNTEQALDQVMGRIRRRRRRSGALAVVTVLVVLVGATWLVTRSAAEDSSVYVGDPTPTVVGDPVSDATALREMWRAPQLRVGTIGVLGNGRASVLSDESVFVAGDRGMAPSAGQTEIGGRVTALDRETGEERWVADLDEPAFLQGVAGSTLIANAQYDRILGLDPEDGSVEWEISLPTLGLSGYGAVVSAVGDPMTVIGLSAEGEGDVREPVLLGVAPSSGKVQWVQHLVEGTDLNWGAPPIDGGQVVFQSTVSHPGSATGNVAHLVTVADGSIVWASELGGGQRYSHLPAVIDGALVHLQGPDEIVAVDRNDGTRRWSAPGHAVLKSQDEVWLIRDEAPDGSDRSVVVVDPLTGSTRRELGSPIDAPQQLLDLGGQRVGVVSRSEIAVVDANGRVLGSWTWGGQLIEPALFDLGQIFGATEGQGVTVLMVGSPISVLPTRGATISLGIYSGREDPVWPLDDRELELIIDAVEARPVLPEMTESSSASDPTTQMGFRGIVVSYVAAGDSEPTLIWTYGTHLYVERPGESRQQLDDPEATVMLLAAPIVSADTDDPLYLDFIDEWTD